VDLFPEIFLELGDVCLQFRGTATSCNGEHGVRLEFLRATTGLLKLLLGLRALPTGLFVALELGFRRFFALFNFAASSREIKIKGPKDRSLEPMYGSLSPVCLGHRSSLRSFVVST
jgi:hypothetical protein